MKGLNEKTAGLLKVMEESAQPALQLLTAPEPGFSKLGGLPNLPSGLVWPFWRDRPLSFVAQLDLAELKAAETRPDFPAEGRLYFFFPDYYDHEWEQPWGSKPEHAGSARVFYSLAEAGPEIQPPEELGRLKGSHYLSDDCGIYDERFLMARPMLSYPPPDYLTGFRRVTGEMSEAEFKHVLDPLNKAYEQQCARYFSGNWPMLRHQLGGFPIPEQFDDMALECQLAANGFSSGGKNQPSPEEFRRLAQGAADWQLLLQLDSDPGDPRHSKKNDYMAWGSEGLIYFWIRKQDLANRDFSRVWAILQCT